VTRDNTGISVSRLCTIFIAWSVAGTAACASAPGGTREPSPAIPTFSVDSVIRDSAGTKLSAVVGTVEDSASGQPLAGVQVRLTSRVTSRQYYYFSDERGGFVAQGLPPAVYDVLIRYVAYRPYVAPISLSLGVVDTLRVRLGRFPY
jgi:hypothetical protein